MQGKSFIGGRFAIVIPVLVWPTKVHKPVSEQQFIQNNTPTPLGLSKWQNIFEFGMQNRFTKAAAVHDLMRAVLANICKRAINVIANRILFIDLPEWSIVLIYYVDMYFRNNAGIVLRSIIQLRDLFSGAAE